MQTLHAADQADSFALTIASKSRAACANFLWNDDHGKQGRAREMSDRAGTRPSAQQQAATESLRLASL